MEYAGIALIGSCPRFDLSDIIDPTERLKFRLARFPDGFQFRRPERALQADGSPATMLLKPLVVGESIG
jgi:hypothetical protein